MTTARLIKDSGRERLAFGDNYFGISVTIVGHFHERLSVFLGW
jgi:hypothetical protein